MFKHVFKNIGSTCINCSILACLSVFCSMKTKVTFQYLLPGTASEISTFFSNFNLFGKCHPYMIEVTEIKNTSTSNRTYRINESLKLWNFIPMKPSYDVEVTIIEPEKHIHYKSEVSKGVLLEIDYTFVENKNSNEVKVVEAIMLKGYPIINPVFLGLLKKTRPLLFESIRKELEKQE